jgi:hypothetical protein
MCKKQMKGTMLPLKTTQTINLNCMRKSLIAATVSFFILACSNNGSGKQEGGHELHDSVQTNNTTKDTTKKSIPSQTEKNVANTDIKINYHAPAVRGRTIWGGLVAYDAVWVTGAHKATTLEVGKDFIVGDKTIPAGKYAIFTIPGKEEWTVIINKNWNQHLADDYSDKEDVVRIKVKPQVTQEVTERLKYEIEKTGERTANIIISWEKLKVPFGIKIK